jgi:DDE domain
MTKSRHRQPQAGDIWHLDEIIQGRRDTAAEKRLLVRLMKKHGQTPKRFITDKLRSYGAARRKIVPGVEHRSHKGLNNAPRTAICHSESGKGRCQGIDRGVACSGLCQSIPPFKIASPFLPAAAPH